MPDAEEVFYEQWLNVSGAFRRPDLFLVFEKIVYLFEFKLTFTEDAFDQLWGYASAIAAIFHRPTAGIQVCCNLTAKATRYEEIEPKALLRTTHEGPFVIYEPLLHEANI